MKQLLTLLFQDSVAIQVVLVANKLNGKASPSGAFLYLPATSFDLLLDPLGTFQLYFFASATNRHAN
ncbi:hypothetical protein KCG43_20230 [Photobacterium sp. WH24]|uniref:hypothetical protein n=1 Tax=Photobacterium sp. WH24 TaxID=2827237 RepID=UPI001C459AFA|nr:hypothetical protein [Photobacterium sp. WH24]MBV7264343.1 hypothetical protein [Photobacterium sp. WH24]